VAFGGDDDSLAVASIDFLDRGKELVEGVALRVEEKQSGFFTDEVDQAGYRKGSPLHLAGFQFPQDASLRKSD